jgi:phosphinothricin acetyltransferase
MKIVSINRSNFPEVQRIYKEGIDTGVATFETKIPNWTHWDANHLSFGRILLIDGNQFLGWAALSVVSKREVYSGVAEVSVYVSKNYRGQNIGDYLLKALIKVSQNNTIWTLQAAIMRANEASIKLHTNNGFRIVGYKEKIGKLKGIWLDNIILERRSNIIGI